MADFEIKRGTTLDSLRTRLVSGTGQRAYLVGASVQFRMRKVGAGVNAIDTAATIVDPLQGVVEYDWQPGDTDIAGDYWAEFEVTYPDTRTRTWPSEGYILITVTETLT